MDRPPVDRTLGLGINEDPLDIFLGDQVWALHLACMDAAAVDSSVYTASGETDDQIREYAEHREAELAFDLVLACGTPALPLSLVAHAKRVGRLLSPDEASDEEVDAYVTGWLNWQLGCGFDPPCWT